MFDLNSNSISTRQAQSALEKCTRFKRNVNSESISPVMMEIKTNSTHGHSNPVCAERGKITKQLASVSNEKALQGQ